MEPAMPPFETDQLAGLFLRPERIQDQGHAVHGQTDVFDPKTGKIELQYDRPVCFIYIDRRTIFMTVRILPQLQRMEEVAYLTDMTAENFMLERLFPRKSCHARPPVVFRI